MELQGKTAVVTGAASGIGLALTERFLDEGMSVVMADVEADRLEREVGRLKGAGGAVHGEVCDVSDPDQVIALRDRALDSTGAVHVVCNNAGVATGQPVLKTKPEVWQWVIGVDLLGVAYGCSTFGPLLVEQGEGHIVNTASEAGLVASPLLGAYHPAKYGVVGLSEALAMELDGTGVGVSCLCPELVYTRIFTSGRNAPESFGWPKPPDLGQAEMEAFIGNAAMPAAHVAAEVAYAIRSGQFWVVTHDQSIDRIRARNDDLERARTPRFRAG